MKNLTFAGGAAILALGALAFAGCGDKSGGTGGASTSGTGSTASADNGNLSGTIRVDGSTTVYPIVSAMAEDFAATTNNKVEIPVGKKGTGSGMKAFIAGEIDIATASRPIDAEEAEKAKAAGIDFIEIPVAFDGISVIVNPQNEWTKDITVADLQKVWQPNSAVKTWNQINPAYPAEAITLMGPTDNHGTFEYFTEAVVGKKNQIRKDYQPNQEYTTIVQAVAADKNAMAFVGYNYFAENTDKVKALPVAGISPSTETIADGTYTPLSRPLFLYVSKKSMERPEVKAFVEFALGEGLSTVEEAKYVKLPQEAYDKIKSNVQAMKTGSLFQDVKPGTKITEILSR